MKVLKLVFSRATLVLLGLIALGLIVWFVGPLIAIASWHPLESSLVRMIAVAAILVSYVGRWVWRRFQAKRQNTQLADGLMRGTAPSPATPAAGEQEVAVLRQRFEEAISILKQGSKAGNRAGRWGRQYLYELPWYMFIGAPGSGKTTALVNSGLRFPLGERFGHAAVSGYGGTRNCDWWFTDHAVLIDTAGRYTTQESDREADSAAWQGFLKLLSRYRPRRPINGALLTISVADLLQQSAAEADAHANALRSRIQELYEQLNVRFPIYVFVTKADLLPGFMEFFGNCTRKEREQVWGTTFPLPEEEKNVLEQFEACFADLEQRLNGLLLPRLEQERDVQTRTLLYAFPQHFSAIREPLSQFLNRVFAPSRYERPVMLRGVYFISGTQEGSPIDRLMGGLARALGLERKVLQGKRSSARSFFISRLFNDVIFKESDLAGTNLRWERHRGMLQWASLGTAVLLTLTAIAAWIVSYSNNETYVSEVDSRIKATSEQVVALGRTPSMDVVELLAPLRELRDIARPGVAPAGTTPISMTFGLYQGEKLEAAADAAYRRLLNDVFLQRVAARIEQQLRGRGQQNVELLYEALKAHVMLTDAARYDAKGLKAFIMAEWDSNLPRSVTTEQRRELESHLDVLLSNGAVTLATQPDREVIASARETISRIPLAERAYGRLKLQGVGADLPEFTIAGAGGPSAPLVFMRASGRPLTTGVPGLFSQNGYYNAFLKAVEPVAAQLNAEEPWVLGLKYAGKSRPADSAAKERLMDDVRRLYLDEYVGVWDAFIRDIKLVRSHDLQQSIALARILSTPDSPLPALLRALVATITLTKDDNEKSEKSIVDGAADAIRKRRDDLAKIFGTPRDSTPVIASKPEAIVDEHFSALRRLVRPAAPGQPAPIDSTTALMNEVYTHLTAAQAAVSAGTPPPPNDIQNKLKAESARLPEPVQSVFTSLSQSSAQLLANATRRGLSERTASVADFCRKAIGGRYPFDRGSLGDVTRDDFSRLFAPGGALDDFFQKNLAAYVDTSARPWRFRKMADASLGEAGNLVQFQRAQTIRDVFFRGGTTPAVKLDIKPIALDASISQLVLDIDGQVVKYSHGPQVPVPVQWPGPKGSSQVRLYATLAGGGNTPSQSFEGPWALFRLLDRAQLQPTSQPEKMIATFNLEGRRAQFEINSASVQNPLRLPELEQFRCPDRL